MNIFRTGLFENPYLEEEESKEIVGAEEYVKAGYQAQLDSIVLLKNKGGILPLAEKTRVYVPKRHIGERKGFFQRHAARAGDPAGIKRTSGKTFYLGRQSQGG